MAGIGDVVVDGDFEFVVNGVQTGVSNVGGEWGQSAQGEYTIVTMTVKNIGDRPNMFSAGSDIVGMDSKGREFSNDTTAGIYANDDAEGFLTEINPGNSVTANVVFDLPAGVKLTSLTVSDSFFGGTEVSLA